MTLNEYQTLAMRTAKRVDFWFDLNHTALGLAGEAGEFADCVKRYTIYNKPLDKSNALEELGDLMWFIALACEVLGVSMEDVTKTNIDKLKLRYPQKYSDKLAQKRLDKEVA